MYLFSLAFSIGWSCIGFGIVHSIDKKTGMVSGSVVALLIFAYSLWFHKDYFEFRRNASVSEIERL
ncbi:MAG: hypothetical protein JWR44_1403 [Hymenobacter sp.]|nr:hypothetical protein [Hymenobacter sp.]